MYWTHKTIRCNSFPVTTEEVGSCWHQSPNWITWTMWSVFPCKCEVPTAVSLKMQSLVDIALHYRKYPPSDMASKHRRIQNFHVMINWNWRYNLIFPYYYNNIQVSKYYIFLTIVMVTQVEAKTLKRKINQIYGQ